MKAFATLLLGFAAFTAMLVVFIGIMDADQTQGPLLPVIYACMGVALTVPLTAFWAWRRLRAGRGLWPVVLTMLHWAAVPGLLVAVALLIGG